MGDLFLPSDSSAAEAQCAPLSDAMPTMAELGNRETVRAVAATEAAAAAQRTTKQKYLALAVGAIVVALAGCGGATGGSHSQSHTTTATTTQSTSLVSAGQLVKRLAVAGIDASESQPTGDQQGVVGEVSVDGPSQETTMAVAFFDTVADAEAYAEAGAGGVAAGRGAIRVVDKHVYIVADENGLAGAEHALFNHVVVIGEGMKSAS